MAMRPKLWTLSGLEAELGRDRRTIAKALKHVRPDGKVNKHEAWHMTTAIEALKRHGPGPAPGAVSRTRETPPPVPPGFEAITKVEDARDCNALAGMLALAYRVPRIAASLAAGTEAPLKYAYALHRALRLGMFMAVAEICAEWQIEPFTDPETAELMDPDAFEGVAWDRLAKGCGEPLDLEAWEAWARHCYGPGSYERTNAEEAARAAAGG